MSRWPTSETALETSLRADLSALCRRLSSGGYVVATDGNVSARLPDGRLIVTPSGLEKGEIGPEDLVLTDRAGLPLDATARRPSSEVLLHVVAYEERPDARVVCHAHPPIAVALSAAGVDVSTPRLPEIVIGLGRVAVAPYATPSSPASAEAARPFFKTCDAIVLGRHGSVTLGKSARAAFHVLERLEWSARVLHAALLHGPVAALPDAEVERLLALRSRYLGIA